MEQGYFTTREKLLTRRGVLWLGQTCNLRCHFCYFLDRIEDNSHPEHAFMDLEKAKRICHELRYRYGNTAIDIQGGEPTIYPRINELVAYCREIGLLPSLITNGLVLARREKCEQLKAAGLRDLKISVLGFGSVFDETVGRDGSSFKQALAIQNCIDLDIPFRINCVVTVNVLPQLVDIAELAVASGALGVNFLGLNPFQDQNTGKRTSHNVARYSEAGEALDRALDVLAAAGVEANVRYLPICTVSERHWPTVYNHQQLSYDAQEWDYDSWQWTGQLPQQMKDVDTSPHHTSLADVTYAAPAFAPPPGRMSKVAAPVRAAARRALAPFPRAKNVARRGYAVAQRLARAARPTPAPHPASVARAPVHVDDLSRDPQVYWDTGIVRARNRAEDGTTYEYPPQCADCDAIGICDGFHSDYADLFGTSEATPIRIGQKVSDPRHFILDQVKVYEPDEAARPFVDTVPYVARPASGDVTRFWNDTPSAEPVDDASETVTLGATRRRPSTSN